MQLQALAAVLARWVRTRILQFPAQQLDLLVRYHQQQAHDRQLEELRCFRARITARQAQHHACIVGIGPAEGRHRIHIQRPGRLLPEIVPDILAQDVLD